MTRWSAVESEGSICEQPGIQSGKNGGEHPHLPGTLTKIERGGVNMDGVETPEMGGASRGGRPPKTVTITANLAVADMEILEALPILRTTVDLI
jgi:hypothetical protein